MLRKEKKSNNCGILAHIAKKCRKPKKSQSQTSQPQDTKVNQIDLITTKSDNEESGNYITSYREVNAQVYDSNYYSDSDYYVAAISSGKST